VNRRSFAVLERLGETAGTGPVMLGDFDSMPKGLSREQRAMALAEAGWRGLALAIETSGMSKQRWRHRERSVWRAINPERGARATIFFAHGLAATLERLAHYTDHPRSADRQRAARRLLHSVFPWPENEETKVEEETQRINPVTAEGGGDVFVSLSFHAIASIVGPAKAECLPGFTGLEDPDEAAYFGALGWQNCFNSAVTPWVQVTDPEGMTKGRPEYRSVKTRSSRPLLS
jgi:hypothetical protein